MDNPINLVRRTYGFMGVASGETDDERSLSSLSLDPADGTPVAGGVAYDVELPTGGVDLVAFELVSGAEPVSLLSAYYYAQVDEADVNDVRLALSTTTFRKEHYIVPNIELVRAGLSDEADPIAGHFHMRTLASVELVRSRETSAARVSRLLPSSTESPDTRAVPSAWVAVSSRSRDESSTAS